MLSLIARCIPVEVKVKTLYWKRKEREMEKELKTIFEKIDNDDYKDIPKLIDRFRRKWETAKLPMWLAIKSAEVSRAEAMHSVLTGGFFI